MSRDTGKSFEIEYPLWRNTASGTPVGDNAWPLDTKQIGCLRGASKLVDGCGNRTIHAAIITLREF